MFTRSFVAAASGFLLASPALGQVVPPVSKSCPIDAPLSCQDTSNVEDTCCFNSPGGLVMLTEFWNTAPATGPEDSWTIHGLWPDNCDGTYEEFCDKDREYFNITSMLETRAPCTLKYMNTFWPDNKGDYESFWQHEFNKHGTCMSTLEPQCYTGYHPGDEVVDYFKRTVKLFKTLPSYKWLAEAGIVPSSTATYTRAEIQAAIKKNHGAEVIINCSGNKIVELWYYYNVRGSIQHGEFVPVQPQGAPSSCPATGIRYPPKNPSSGTTSSAVPSSTATSTSGSLPDPTGVPGSLSGRGRLYVDTPGVANGGFMISAGTWYRGGGTPATYTATPIGDGSTFELTTSRGKCAVSADVLRCAADVSVASAFGYDGSFLTYQGANTFYADALPSGNTQGVIYTAQRAVSFQASWTALQE